MQKINNVNELAVKTHGGLSQRKVVDKIICQGEPWGPIECSLQVDSIGKESLNSSLQPYKYKDEVEIPALGFVDDVITVAESGYKTARLNSFMNAQFAMKKLRLGPKKCFSMHVGRKHEEYKNVQLYFDGWNVKSVNMFESGDMHWNDIINDDMNELSHIDTEKYLGQVISSDSKNTYNIEQLRNKGIGIQNKIITMLERMPGGPYHFEIAVILRNALLISSILSNSEVWYGLTKLEIEQLEQIDEMWIRNLFDLSRNVPKDLLYLEVGLVPISFIIKSRKQMFLHHILQQKKDSLIHKFFMTQMKSPTQNDWVSSVLEEQEELEINLELEEIEEMSKDRFKSIVKEKVEVKAFEYLIKKKGGRTSDNAKGKYLKYESLEMAEYLSSSEEDMSISEKKWLFKCHIEDIEISSVRKWNNEYDPCTNCKGKYFDQNHLMNCPYLLGKNEILTYIPESRDIFNGNLEEQIYASRILKENHKCLRAQQRTM